MWRDGEGKRLCSRDNPFRPMVERFQAKWGPVRVKKRVKHKNLEPVSIRSKRDSSPRHEAGARKSVLDMREPARSSRPEVAMDHDCGTIDVCSIGDKIAAGDE
jgi:hypothetical protein